MNVFTEQLSSPKAQEAEQVRRTVRQTFERIEANLEVIRGLYKQHGVADIQTALGGDAPEVAFLYRALRGVVLTHKPGAVVDDLPTE